MPNPGHMTIQRSAITSSYHVVELDLNSKLSTRIRAYHTSRAVLETDLVLSTAQEVILHALEKSAARNSPVTNDEDVDDGMV